MSGNRKAMVLCPDFFCPLHKSKKNIKEYIINRIRRLEDNRMEREKDHVRCITVVHPLHKIREYREFSAFFRLMGIFVCENIAREEYGNPTDYEIDIPEENGQNSAKKLSPVLYEMDEVFSVDAIQIFQ